MTSFSSNLTKIVLSLGMGCLFFLLHYHYFLINIDFHHDGVILKPALDIVSGMKLFKETFTQYGPLHAYMNALAVSLLGPYVSSIRIMTNLTYALTFILLTFTALRVLPVFLAVLVVIFQCSLVSSELPWASVASNLFVVLTVYSLIVANHSRWPNLSVWISGFSCAMIFWTRQAVGISMTTAMFSILLFAVVFAKEHFKWKQFVAFLIGLGLGYWLFIKLFHLQHSYDFWHLQNIEWPQRWESRMRGINSKETLIPYMLRFFWNMEGPIHVIFPTFFGISIIYFFLSKWFIQKKTSSQIMISFALTLILLALRWYFPFYGVQEQDKDYGQFVFVGAILIGVLIGVWGLFKPLSRDLFNILILGGGVAATWLHIYPLPDAPHLTWGLILTFLFSIYVLYILLRKNIVLCISIAYIFYGSIFSTQIKKMYSRAHLDPGPIVTDNRSILFGTPEKKQGELPLWEGLAYVEAFIAKHSNLPIVNFTDHAIFAAAAKNLLMPDPYPIWWGWLDFPNIMHFSWQSRLDFIRKFRPLIVAHVAFEETYGPFLQNNNYIIAKKFGEIVVLVDAHLSLY